MAPLVAGGEWYARRLRSRASCVGKPPLREAVARTTPRCQRAARGRVLPLPNPQTAALGAAGRGGLAGARKRLACQQHFSDSTRFSGSHEAGPSLPLPIRWHLAPRNWPTQQSRSSWPARTARQYPMLDALYISNSTGLNVFIVGGRTY